MKILVVDDDVMLADLLEDLLLHQGHEVCGVATNVADAVALVRLHRPEIAILDMKLRGVELGSDIVHRLAESDDLTGLGILYITGGPAFAQQRACIGHAYLQKPYSAATLAAALPIVQGIVRHGAAPGALPYGMQLLGMTDHAAST